MADHRKRRMMAGLLLSGLGAGVMVAFVYSMSMARTNNPIVLREASIHCAKLKVGDDLAEVRQLGKATGAEVREFEDRIELRYRRPFSERLGCIAYFEDGKVRKTFFEDFPPEFPGEFELP
jgi:hypothetical protein